MLRKSHKDALKLNCERFESLSDQLDPSEPPRGIEFFSIPPTHLKGDGMRNPRILCNKKEETTKIGVQNCDILPCPEKSEDLKVEESCKNPGVFSFADFDWNDKEEAVTEEEKPSSECFCTPPRSAVETALYPSSYRHLKTTYKSDFRDFYQEKAPEELALYRSPLAINSNPFRVKGSQCNQKPVENAIGQEDQRYPAS